MNGRSNVLIALATLLAAAFAGCVEAPSFLTQSDAEATARENKDLADNAALAWNPEAVLVGIAAFEASAAHAAESKGLLPADPTVGNGRALLWFYAYQTPGGAESRLFRVDADGRIQVENTSMVPMGDIGSIEPLGSWSVDSDAAMAAAQADEKFRAVAAAENASVVSAVGNHEGSGKWALVAMNEEKVVGAVVDAVTGELLLVEATDLDEVEIPVMPGTPGFERAPPVHVEGEGSLDTAEPVAEFPFTYAGMGDAGLLQMESSTRFPGDRFTWKIVDEAGETVASSRGGFLLPRSGASEAEFELTQPGEYVLVLAYSGATPLAMGGADYAFVLDVGGDLVLEDEEEDA